VYSASGKNAEAVVQALQMWDDYQGGFDDETTKVEVPSTMWDELNAAG